MLFAGAFDVKLEVLSGKGAFEVNFDDAQDDVFVADEGDFVERLDPGFDMFVGESISMRRDNHV